MFSLRATIFLTLGLLATQSGSAQIQADENNIDYVLSRYIESMGGRASLQKIISVRLKGELLLADGSKASLTVLSKKPNLVRVTTEWPNLRIVQGYDGTNAWVSRTQAGSFQIREMEGNQRNDFIVQAPLTSNLIRRNSVEGKLALGPELKVAMRPCYQVISTSPNGSKTIHYIDKESFYDLRILTYDPEGNLTSELVPSKFEIADGILFAMQIKQLVDRHETSTVVFHSVETNLGIINTAFSMQDAAEETNE